MKLKNNRQKVPKDGPGLEYNCKRDHNSILFYMVAQKKLIIDQEEEMAVTPISTSSLLPVV